MKTYAIRYSVEDWNRPTPEGGTKVQPGVTVSPDDHGYTDWLFLLSVVRNLDGKDSFLLLDSADGPDVRKATCDRVIEAIEHYRDHHAKD